MNKAQRLATLLAAVCIGACAIAPPVPMASHDAAATGTAQVWLSTADGRKQLSRENDLAIGRATTVATASALSIEIDADKRHQEMIGFGAAITDASAWLIEQRMSAAQRDALLRELFGRDDGGIGLSFARLTIGASDFSRRHYSLDDMPAGQRDPTLAHFSIEPADADKSRADRSSADVLPVVRTALAINPHLRVMASPWSAPGWMKTTDSLIAGTLREDAYAPFADYLVRYVDAYARAGVPLFALTVQNEPGFAPGDYPGMQLDASQRARLIGEFLGPRLAREHAATRILDWDHNWDKPDEPLRVLADPVARRYVDGVAWHCYAGNVAAQTPVHDAFPDKEAYLTECSGGSWVPLKTDSLLTLTRNLIIGATRGWAKGVLLWNLALDENRGPHAGGCDTCRGVVTIDSKTGAVTRTVDYTVLAHASRFIRPGAQRVESSAGTSDLDNVAFRNADDGSLVLIVANSARSAQRFSVRGAGRTFAYEMPGRSVATLVW